MKNHERTLEKSTEKQISPLQKRIRQWFGQVFSPPPLLYDLIINIMNESHVSNAKQTFWLFKLKHF